MSYNSLVCWFCTGALGLLWLWQFTLRLTCKCVYLCVYIEPVSRSKCYVWCSIKIGSALCLYTPVYLTWRVYKYVTVGDPGLCCCACVMSFECTVTPSFVVVSISVDKFIYGYICKCLKKHLIGSIRYICTYPLFFCHYDCIEIILSSVDFRMTALSKLVSLKNKVMCLFK